MIRTNPLAGGLQPINKQAKKRWGTVCNVNKRSVYIFSRRQRVLKYQKVLEG